MNDVAKTEELDQAIDAVIANGCYSARNSEVAELLGTACELRELPRPDFKMRLKAELNWVACARPLSPDRQSQTEKSSDILPSLFGEGYGTYPVRRINFAVSAAAHLVAVLLVLWLGILAFQEPKLRASVVTGVVTLSEYVPPVGDNQPHGGGSGGGADKLNASHGGLPKTALQQLASPVVVVRNSDPKLPAEPTIIAPNLQVPQASQMGDPLSRLMSPSSGTGVTGGIGSNTGGGVGPGEGPGYGPGGGGNYGDHLYAPGNGVSAPRVIYDPDPEYSPEARAAKYEGTVILHAIVAPDGRPRAVQVARSLGMGLDEKAVEAVNTWRFEPAQKDGHAVPVMIEIYVSFHLY